MRKINQSLRTMCLRLTNGSAWILVAFLFVFGACDSTLSLTLETDRTSLSRSGESVEYILSAVGSGRDIVDISEIEIFSSPSTTGSLEQIAINTFRVYFEQVTGDGDVDQFVVQAVVRGARAQSVLPFVSGQASVLQIDLEKEFVTTDDPFTKIIVRSLDANGRVASLQGLELQTSYGRFVSFETFEARGEAHVSLVDLFDTAQSPVTIEATLGTSSTGSVSSVTVGGSTELRATSQFELLVGRLGGFAIVPSPDVQAQVSVAYPVTIRATDKYGNFRSAYDGNVQLQVDEPGQSLVVTPLQSNSFRAGVLQQNIVFAQASENAVLTVSDTKDASAKGELAVGSILPQPIRCMEMRREGLSSRIFTANEGNDPNGVIFNLYMYSIDCNELDLRLDAGENLSKYIVQGVTPLVTLTNASGTEVGRSDTAGHSDSDRVGDLEQAVGFIKVPLFNMTDVENSPFQLVARVGSVVAQTQVEITPGEWKTIGFDPVPQIAAQPLANPVGGFFSPYIRAFDEFGNQVFTVDSVAQCNYAGANSLSEAIEMPQMTLGAVATLVQVPENAGSVLFQCWFGGATYATSPIRGEVTLDVVDSGAVEIANVATYVDEFVIVLPGQTFNNGSVSGSPDDQIANEPFVVDLYAKNDNDLGTNPSFTGTVYLASLLGRLETRSDASSTENKIDSPLSNAFNGNGVNVTEYSRLQQTVVINTAGTQQITVNQPDASALPVPGPRSNIGLGTQAQAADPLAFPNRSSFFQVLSAEFNRFEFQDIPSPQIVSNPFLLEIEAVDVSGNRVDGYDATVDLSDLSDTLTVDSLQFQNGLLQTQATVRLPKYGNEIYVETGDGYSGTSNVFDVLQANTVESFLIYPVEATSDCSAVQTGQNPPATEAFGTVTAASSFAFMVVARDSKGKVANISWPVSLTDTTSTLSPLISKPLVNGCVIVPAAAIAKVGTTQITGSLEVAGVSAIGKTNFFSVEPGPPASVEVELLSPTPIVRNTGLMNVRYRVEDSAGNLVTGFNESVTVSAKNNTIVGGPFSSPTTNGIGQAGMRFSQISATTQVHIEHGSVPYPFFEGSSEEFVVLVFPDDFEISLTDATDIGSVTAYSDFEVEIVAKLGGNILPEFTGPVSLSTTNGRTVSPNASATFSGGVVTQSIQLRTDTQGSDELLVSFATETDSIQTASNTFSIGTTVYVDIESMPSKVDDGSDHTLDLFVRKSTDGTVLTDYTGTITVQAYSGPNQTCSGVVGVGGYSFTGIGEISFVSGAATMDLEISDATALNTFGAEMCLGAVMQDSDVIHYGNPVRICSDAADANIFEPNCP